MTILMSLLAIIATILGCYAIQGVRTLLRCEYLQGRLDAIDGELNK